MPEPAPAKPSYKIYSIVVPEGVAESDHTLRAAICLSPRFIGDPDKSDTVPTGAEIFGAINEAVKGFKTQSPVYITSDNPPQIVAIKLAQEWEKIWDQGNEAVKDTEHKASRAEVWDALIPEKISSRKFSAQTAQLAHAASAGEAESQTRAGNQAVESFELGDLESNVHSVYAQMAVDLSPPPANSDSPHDEWNARQAKIDSAKTFRDEVGVEMDAQIRRFSVAGSVRAANADPITGKSEESGKPDEFHEVFTRLLEYPKLMRYLGLIIDVEINANELKTAAVNAGVVPDSKERIERAIDLRCEIRTPETFEAQGVTGVIVQFEDSLKFELQGAQTFIPFRNSSEETPELEIVDMPAFVAKLKTRRDTTAAFLVDNFDDDLRKRVAGYIPIGTDRWNLKNLLEARLRALINDPAVHFSLAKFPSSLRGETRQQVASAPAAPETKKSLLQDAFPLELSGLKYRLLQTDVMNAAFQAFQMREAGVDEAVHPSGPPPLRTSGISVIYASKNWIHDKVIGDAHPGKFDADDLQRGDVVHVLDKTGEKKWKSLVSRQSAVVLQRLPTEGDWKDGKKPALEAKQGLLLVWLNGRHGETVEVRKLKNFWGEPPPLSAILKAQGIRERDLAEEETGLTLALHQSPQPISGVPIKRLKGSSRDYIIATPQGDMQVQLSAKTAGSDDATEPLQLFREYQFIGQLKKTKNTIATDYILSVDSFSAQRDALVGTAAIIPDINDTKTLWVTVLNDSATSYQQRIAFTPPLKGDTTPLTDRLGQIFGKPAGEISLVARGSQHLVETGKKEDVLAKWTDYTPRISTLSRVIPPQVVGDPFQFEFKSGDIGTFVSTPKEGTVFDVSGVVIPDYLQIHQGGDTSVYYSTVDGKFHFLPPPITMAVSRTNEGKVVLYNGQDKFDLSTDDSVEIEISVETAVGPTKLRFHGKDFIADELMDGESVDVQGYWKGGTFTLLRVTRNSIDLESANRCLVYITGVNQDESQFRYWRLGGNGNSSSPIPPLAPASAVPIPRIGHWAFLKLDELTATTFQHIPQKKRFWGMLALSNGTPHIITSIGKWPLKMDDNVRSLADGTAIQAEVPGTPTENGTVTAFVGIGVVRMIDKNSRKVVPLLGARPLDFAKETLKDISGEDILVRFAWLGGKPYVKAARLIAKITEHGTPDNLGQSKVTLDCSGICLMDGDGYMEFLHPVLSADNSALSELISLLSSDELEKRRGKFSVLNDDLSEQFVADPDMVLVRPKSLRGCVIDTVKGQGFIFRAFNADPKDFGSKFDQVKFEEKLGKNREQQECSHILNACDHMFDIGKFCAKAQLYTLAGNGDFAPSDDLVALAKTAPQNEDQKAELNRIALHDAFPTLVPKWPVYFDIYCASDSGPDPDVNVIYKLDYAIGSKATVVKDTDSKIRVPPSLQRASSDYLNLVSQAVLNWSGWSLAIPHPLEATGSDDSRFQPGSLLERLRKLSTTKIPVWQWPGVALDDNDDKSVQLEKLEKSINEFIGTESGTGPEDMPKDDRRMVIETLKKYLPGSRHIDGTPYGFSDRTLLLSQDSTKKDTPKWRRSVVDDFLDYATIRMEEMMGRLNLFSIGGVPPGSLPSLHTGGEYQFRLSPLYLTGRTAGLRAPSPDISEVSETLKYMRGEPLAAPEVFGRNIDTDGINALTNRVVKVRQLVFRSEWRDGEYVIDSTVPSEKELSILPPQMSQDPRVLVAQGVISANNPGDHDLYNLAVLGSETLAKIPLKPEEWDGLSPMSLCWDKHATRLCIALTGSPFTWRLNVGDINDPKWIIDRLRYATEPDSFYAQVWSHFDEQAQGKLTDQTIPVEEKLDTLTDQLNAVFRQPATCVNWYQPKGIVLRDVTSRAAESRPHDKTLLWLKRLIYEDAFNGAIESRPLPPEGTWDGSLPVKLVKFEGKWPSVRPVPITVRAVKDGDLTISSSGGRFYINVPPGEVADLKLSATVAPQDFDLLHLSTIMDRMAPESFEKVKCAVLDGQHSLVSGSVTIRLIHAVNKPTEKPRFLARRLSRKIEREPGARTARIISRLAYDPATTGRIVLNAAWPVYADNLGQIAPTMPLEDAVGIFDPFLESWNREKMDEFLTKMRILPENRRKDILDDVMVAHLGLEEKKLLTRFVDHFAVDRHQMAVVSSRSFSRPDPGALPDFLAHDFVHTFDDTAFHSVQYTPRGTTCFESLVVHSESTDGPAENVDIPATISPSIPEIAFVLPLYGLHTMDQRGKNGVYVQHRKGFAMRIFLQRPWLSTGRDEKLAVIFPNQWPPAKEMRKYITEWGFDPAWVSPSSIKDRWRHLMASDVGRSADQSGFGDLSVTLPAPMGGVDSKQSLLVDAVIHSVRYSPRRGLWYADVVFTEECERVYAPFIKLAVARYQPNALTEARLSNIVQMDFIPLSNSRTAQLHRSKNGSSITLKVTGVFPQSEAGDMDSLPADNVNPSFPSSDVVVSTFELPASGLSSDDNGYLGMTQRKLIVRGNDSESRLITLEASPSPSIREAKFDVPQRSSQKMRRFLRIYERQKHTQRGGATDANNYPVPYDTIIPID